jgi:hypothetical protein
MESKQAFESKGSDVVPPPEDGRLAFDRTSESGYLRRNHSRHREFLLEGRPEFPRFYREVIVLRRAQPPLQQGEF